MFDLISSLVIGLLVIVALAVLVGKFMKNGRTDEEQAQEDMDQAAYLTRLDRPVDGVHTVISPITGRYVSSRRVDLGYDPSYDDVYRPEPVDLNEFDKPTSTDKE